MSEQGSNNGRRPGSSTGGSLHGQVFQNKAARSLAVRLDEILATGMRQIPFRGEEVAHFSLLPSGEALEHAKRWARSRWLQDSARSAWLSTARQAETRAGRAVGRLAKTTERQTQLSEQSHTYTQLVPGGHVTLRWDNWHLALVLALLVTLFVAMFGYEVFGLANLAATTGDVFTEGLPRALGLTLAVSLCAFVGSTLALYTAPSEKVNIYLFKFSLAVAGVGLLSNMLFAAVLGRSHSFDPSMGDIPPPLPAGWMCGVAGGAMGIVLVSLEILIKLNWQKMLPRETVVNQAAIDAKQQLPALEKEMTDWQCLEGLARDVSQRLSIDLAGFTSQVVGHLRGQQNERAKLRTKREQEVKIANAQNNLLLLDDAA